MKVKLGDVATYTNGYAFKPDDWSDIGLPIIRIQDLTGNSYKMNRYNGTYAEKYEINKGDVLISWSASLGIYIWQGEKAVLNQHIFKVLFDKLDISKTFFVYQVESILNKAKSSAHGATMKHLTKPVFDSLPFYLPDLNEQHHIAAVLDKVSDLIALRKKQLAKLDELVKARFVEMFGDPVLNTKKMDIVYLLDIAEYYNGLTYKPENIKDNGVIILRSSNIKNNHLNFDDIVRVDCNIKARLFVRENDILMCSRNGSSRLVGKVALVDNLFEPMGFGAFMMIVRSSYYSYLLIYFQLEAFRRQIRTGATTTINQITGAMLDKVMLPIPDQDSLESFNIFYKKIKKYEYIIKNSLSKMETLKKSLMQEYFG